jgi:toxin-antitoxin system PIN domain toxin
MLVLDVNVLVYAHRGEMSEHARTRTILEGWMNGPYQFGVPEMVMQSLVRVVTQPAFSPPSSTDEALEFCNRLRASPKCLILWPGERHWEIFEDLCRATTARGKLVADAYLAAFAIDRGDEWVTTDRDFGRFPGLRWRRPWEAQSRTNPR